MLDKRSNHDGAYTMNNVHTALSTNASSVHALSSEGALFSPRAKDKSLCKSICRLMQHYLDEGHAPSCSHQKMFSPLEARSRSLSLLPLAPSRLILTPIATLHSVPAKKKIQGFFLSQGFRIFLCASGACRPDARPEGLGPEAPTDEPRGREA